MTDCLELTKDKNGVSIDGSEEKYRLCIVEYKPSQPKNGLYREEDLMQVFAQKVCVDYVFGSDCDGVLYYADTKKRVVLPLKENYEQYDQQLRVLLTQMREYMDAGIIPPIRKGQKCSGCSMKDLCMPSMKKASNLREEIRKIEEEEL